MFGAVAWIRDNNMVFRVQHRPWSSFVLVKSRKWNILHLGHLVDDQTQGCHAAGQYLGPELAQSPDYCPPPCWVQWKTTCSPSDCSLLSHMLQFLCPIRTSSKSCKWSRSMLGIWLWGLWPAYVVMISGSAGLAPACFPAAFRWNGCWDGKTQCTEYGPGWQSVGQFHPSSTFCHYVSQNGPSWRQNYI